MAIGHVQAEEPNNGLTQNDIQVDITRTALLALISGGTLQVGTKYAITDFQDRNTLDTATRVIVAATSSNTISETGQWLRLTTNKAYGAFAITGGSSGQVTQITVGAINLMTAAIPYTTSRINTANLVAANINANSGVSGYSAVVISGQTTKDVPAIIIEKVAGGVDTNTITVTTTGLATGNKVNMTMGTAEASQVLDIAYDITADRIIECYDPVYNNRMIYTTTDISTFGFNPIVNWRWGHSSFEDWTINGTKYQYFYDFPSTTGSDMIEHNNNLYGGSFEYFVIRRTSSTARSLSDNSGTLSISNAQILSSTSSTLSGNSVMVSCTNVTVTVSLRMEDNGSYLNNGAVGATRGRLILTDFSGTTVNIRNNNIYSGINLLGTYAATLSIQLNEINSGYLGNSLSTDVYNYTVTLTSNKINTTLTLPSSTAVNFRINISYNSFLSGTGMSMSSFNITTAGKQLSISDSVIPDVFNINSCAPTDDFTISNSDLSASSFTMASTPAIVLINQSRFLGTQSINCTGNVTVSKSVINGDFTYNSTTLNITSSLIDSITFSGTNPVLSLIDSLFKSVVSFTDGGTWTFTSCQIESTTFTGTSGTTYNFSTSKIFNGVYGITDIIGASTFTFTGCYSEGSTMAILDPISGGISPTTTFTNCKFLSHTFNYTLATTALSITNTKFEYNTFTHAASPNLFSLSNCEFLNAHVDMQGSADDFTLSKMTINGTRGLYRASFTFDGTAGGGLAGSACNVLPDMIGRDVFNALITKAIIAGYTGLTIGAGAKINLGHTTSQEYIADTLVSVLNTNYQLTNSPTAQINNATKYTIISTPTVANITAGTAEFEVEFLIVP